MSKSDNIKRYGHLGDLIRGLNEALELSNTGISTKKVKYMKSPLWKVLNDKSEEQADVSKGRFRDQQGYNKKTQESSKKVTEDSKGT